MRACEDEQHRFSLLHPDLDNPSTKPPRLASDRASTSICTRLKAVRRGDDKGMFSSLHLDETQKPLGNRGRLERNVPSSSELCRPRQHREVLRWFMTPTCFHVANETHLSLMRQTQHKRNIGITFPEPETHVRPDFLFSYHFQSCLFFFWLLLSFAFDYLPHSFPFYTPDLAPHPSSLPSSLFVYLDAREVETTHRKRAGRDGHKIKREAKRIYQRVVPSYAEYEHKRRYE